MEFKVLKVGRAGVSGLRSLVCVVSYCRPMVYKFQGCDVERWILPTRFENEGEQVLMILMLLSDSFSI